MIKRGEKMILFVDIIKQQLPNYSNKDTKIAREVRKRKFN